MAWKTNTIASLQLLKKAVIAAVMVVALVAFFLALGEVVIELSPHSALKEAAANLHKAPRDLMGRYFGMQILAFSMLISFSTVSAGLMFGCRPTAQEKAIESGIEVPKRILLEISFCVWGGAIVTMVTAATWITYLVNGPISIAQYTNEITGLEALAIGTATYCIHRKSLVSAILLTSYFMLTGYVKIVANGQMSLGHIIVSGLMAWFCVIGVVGTYRYARLRWSMRSSHV